MRGMLTWQARTVNRRRVKGEEGVERSEEREGRHKARREERGQAQGLPLPEVEGGGRMGGLRAACKGRRKGEE